MSLLFSIGASSSAKCSEADRWHEQAAADYALCRVFADQFDASLERSGRSVRVGWERLGHAVFGILLPDPLPEDSSSDDWYLYYPWGETMLRRTLAERSERRMLVIAESVEDWAGLLRRAIRPLVVDARYELLPDYTDALGETEDVPCGFRFRLFAHAPGAVHQSDLAVTGQGATPAGAARDACQNWLKQNTH